MKEKTMTWLVSLKSLTNILITRGVMVIVIGNGHGDTSSNPKQDWLYFI